MELKQKVRKLKKRLLEERNISIEEALKNRKLNNQKPTKKKNALLTVTIVISILIILSTSIYTGYVAYHEGIGGFIYEIDILFKRPTFSWGGIYGSAFGVGQSQPWEFELDPGGMIEANMFFDCVERDKTNLLFASHVPEQDVSIPSLVPATPQEIDQLIGIDASYYDSALNTFTETMNINLGGRAINNIPTVHTRVGTGTNISTFTTGLLIDENGNYVFVAELNEVLVRGFNNRFYNFQFLLPIVGNETTDYYVFIDPYNVCLGGDDDPAEMGGVYGQVTDISGNPLETVLIVVGGYSTITDDTGAYNLTTEIGTRKIFAILEGYRIYEADVNITLNEYTEHNIILELDTPPVDYTDTGPDIGPDFGPDQGPDQGPGEVPFQIERPVEIEGQDYWIPFNRITKRIREGEFTQETIFIQSFRQGTMQVNIDITGDAARLISIDRQSLQIPYRGDGRATLTFFGNESPGFYNGTANLTGDIEVEIPILVEIIDRDKIPIQALLLGVSMSDKKIYSGSKINFRTDLTNLLTDRAYPVSLLFTIQDLEGKETIWSHTSNVFLETSLSILQNVELPSNLKEGDYVIRVTANYLTLTSSTSHVFTVSLPFYQYTLFWRVKVWHAILGLLLIAAIIIAIIIIKKKLEAKKKYHLKVEYSELPKEGPRSAFIGKIAETNNKAYMNLENFKTHTIVAGSTGGGKSFSAQVIIEEMLLKDVAVIVFDPTAQWTGMLRKLTNKGLMALYPSFWMKEKDAQAFKGNIRQINNSRELIDIRKFMKPGEIQVFAVHKLDPKEIDVFVANTVREVFHANFDESEPLRLCLVYDEVHRLLPKFGGSGEGFLQIERACREFRKWGIGVVLISQVLADFVGQIKANINTEVQMRTRDEGDLERIKTKYGEEVLQSLVKASIGTGMVQNSAYNRGRPYFATFRPIMHSVARLSDEEIEQYNEYNKKIDQLTYELDQLEEEKQDVFDLRLELKLALDKVKAGNFNMVKIYIEGLEPRIKKVWTKVGKEPKILQPKMVSEEELEKELKKAQGEREKFEKENKKEGGDAKEKELTPQEKFKKDVPPDKILKLNNDMLVVTPTSLYSEIESMKDSDYEVHVNESKNDFADWIRNAVNDEELADHLDTTTDRQKILELLDKRAKGEKLPELPPEKKKVKETKKAVEEFEQEPKLTKEKKEKDKIEKIEEDNAEEPKQENKEQAKETQETPKNEEAKQNAENNIKDRYGKKASSDNIFVLEDDEKLETIQDLLDNLDKMPDSVFSNHVTNEKNDFADWISIVFKEKELAEKLRGKKTKNEIKEVLMNG